MHISDTMLQKLKRDYPEGTRVKLIRMDDPYSRLEPGEEGNVIGVDDIGTIHVKWDNGSTLGVVFGEDRCEKLDEKQEEIWRRKKKQHA